MAAPVMGGGAPAEDSAPTEDQRDETEGGGENFVRGDQDNTPTKKRNSHVRTVVKADTSTVTVAKGNEQYSASWVVESPGGTVTTSAYSDGIKSFLSAEIGSGNQRKMVSEQNKTFMRAFAKAAVASA
jgi:hypothetical protein